MSAKKGVKNTGEANDASDMDQQMDLKLSSQDTPPAIPRLNQGNTVWFEQMMSGFMSKQMDATRELIKAGVTEIKTSVSHDIAEIKESHEKYEKKLDVRLDKYDDDLKKQVAATTKLSDDIKLIQAEKKESDKSLSLYQAEIKADIEKLSSKIDSASNGIAPTPMVTSNLTEQQSQITIDGVYESKGEKLLAVCNDVVFALMGLNFTEDHVHQCYRLGRVREKRKSGNGATPRPRTITIKFNDAESKTIVMKQRFNLRGFKLFVDDYYRDPEVVKARRRLQPIMKKARANPDYIDRIALEADKIVLDGNPIGVENLDALPSDIHPRDICTERRDNVTFFFRCDSPLSNHHPCTFTMGDKTFNCSEQAYFYQKAKICKDESAEIKILKTTNPGSQKSQGERIKENADWEKNRLDVMFKVCRAKFEQNPHLMDFLKKTDKTYLAEDNPRDSFFGIGLSRHSPRAKKQTNFKTNNLGLILMKIRDGDF
jgi:hypothetical protein